MHYAPIAYGTCVVSIATEVFPTGLFIPQSRVSRSGIIRRTPDGVKAGNGMDVSSSEPRSEDKDLGGCQALWYLSLALNLLWPTIAGCALTLISSSWIDKEMSTPILESL